MLKNIEGEDDFFITCIGFEDRSLGVLEHFGNYSFSKSFLLKYERVVEVPSADNNENKAHSRLKEIGNVTEINIDPTNPIPALKKLFASMIIDNKDTVKITIDVSSMSRYILLLLLRLLTEEKIIHRTQILYTEPINYVDAEKTPLSIGSAVFEAVPTFEGAHNSRSKNLLIMMLGFEGKRAYSVWDRIEPDKCVLTVPYPPFNPEWGNRTRDENSALINAVGEKNVRMIDSRNPISVLSSLEEILSEYDSQRLMNCFLVPMGTKPQTIGAFLFYWTNDFHPTIMYTYPKKHSEISKGIGNINRLTLINLY